MTIGKITATSFSITGTWKGHELPEQAFEYGVFVGESTIPAIGLWAIRNGVSQALNDAARALGKDATKNDVFEAWDEKADSLRGGNVPTSGTGGPRISLFEGECRAVMIARLTDEKLKSRMSVTDATKIAKSWKAFLSDKATEKAKLTGEDQKTIFELAVARIEDAANKAIEARKTAPSADDLV